MQPPKLDIPCPITQELAAGLALDRYLDIEYLDELSWSGEVAYGNDSRRRCSAKGPEGAWSLQCRPSKTCSGKIASLNELG